MTDLDADRLRLKLRRLARHVHRMDRGDRLLLENATDDALDRLDLDAAPPSDCAGVFGAAGPAEAPHTLPFFSPRTRGASHEPNPQHQETTHDAR